MSPASWAFLPKNKIKTLALMAERRQDAKTGKTNIRAVVVLLRGDHQINEAKLRSQPSAKGNLRPMTEEEIQQLFKSPAGYLGPLGLIGQNT